MSKMKLETSKKKATPVSGERSGLLDQKTSDNHETLNKLLVRANETLSESESNLDATLNSIGDAVIATDTMGNITRMNPVAERLTGWSFLEAKGHSVSEVFRIINKETREPGPIPLLETLAKGTIQGLANHTVLISKDGGEHDIADSCAPIFSHDKKIIGAVLVFRDVTGEFATQQALRDSAALVQAVLNTVVDGIVTLNAIGGLIETVNPAAEKMFGYLPGELKGMNFGLLIPELDQGLQPISLEHYTASEEARTAGLSREVLGKRKNGGTFPLEIAVSEMWLGGQRYFTGLLRDITARRQAEAAFRKADVLQNAIFNSANFSSIATDTKGVIQIFNVGAEQMLGYLAGEVLNKITPVEISDPLEMIERAAALSKELEVPISPGFDAMTFKASRGIEDIYELTYIRKDGSRFPAMVSVTALRDETNMIIGYLLIGTDITVRKKMEADRKLLNETLQEKNIELEAAKNAAEKANLAKSEFLSSMSHELRTPLSAILGFAQLLETGSPLPTSSQKRSIDQILKAGWYLLQLINEILDLALIESGKLAMSLEPVSLGEVLRECESMIEPQAKNSGISISFPHLDQPCYISADRTRVKQILINLLTNAIKYNKANGSVTVELTQNDHNPIRISIRDTGNGLIPEQIGQLFQPFNRLGQESNTVQGTGIGLVVSKRLIESMGGNIGVESTVGEGSVFWIELIRTAKPEYIQNEELPPIQTANTSSEEPKYTILYVEDNPANLMLVEDILARRNDIHLLTAMDGNSGVEIARATLPDVILMDINLPGISGISALRILTEDLSTTHIPIIALSANAIPRDIEKGLAAGFFSYLTKPIKVLEFMKTIDLALGTIKEKM